MSSGMNVEKAKELASRRNYKWAVRNLKGAYGISYKKATKILLYELAEIADRLVLCKDCTFAKPTNTENVIQCTWLSGYTFRIDHYCSAGERTEE